MKRSKTSQASRFASSARRCIAVAVSLLCSGATLATASDKVLVSDTYDPAMISAVAELHGISESAAAKRLMRETEAALLLRDVAAINPASYAGSWFDSESQRLVVALADTNEAELFGLLDLDIVDAERSLDELLDAKATALANLELVGIADGAVGDAKIDVRANRVVISVLEPAIQDASLALAASPREVSDVVDIKTADTMPRLSSVRGAMGTRNYSWHVRFGGDHPCSVGATTINGYLTAGHCGEVGNEMEYTSGTDIGDVIASTWFGANWTPDLGLVDADAGVTLLPAVVGYSVPNFNISSLWGSYLNYPVGTTVCRYGQTSGGPHCGTVNAFNVTVNFGGRRVTGLTELNGSCSDDGDSGGTHVAASNVVQGINVGVQRVNLSDSCPTQAIHVWFQPLEDHLTESGFTNEIVRTPHGANKPSFANSVSCPAGAEHPGVFDCLFGEIHSQGEPEVLWTTSTGASSTISVVTGSCTPGQTVNVTLKGTNTYGTRTHNYSFPCPSGGGL